MAEGWIVHLTSDPRSRHLQEGAHSAASIPRSLSSRLSVVNGLLVRRRREN